MNKLVILQLNHALCNHSSAVKRARSRIDLILREAELNSKQFWRVFEEIEPCQQCAMVDGFVGANECLRQTFFEACARLTSCVGVLPDAMTHIYIEETVGRIRLFDDVLESLVALRLRGVDVAIFALGDSKMQREKFKNLGLHAHEPSSRLFVSEEMGVSQFSREVVLRIANACGASASDVVLVEAKTSDGNLALELADVRTVILDRESLLSDECSSEKITTLCQIVSLVAGSTANDTHPWEEFTSIANKQSGCGVGRDVFVETYI